MPCISRRLRAMLNIFQLEKIINNDDPQAHPQTASRPSSSWMVSAGTGESKAGNIVEVGGQARCTQRLVWDRSNSSLILMFPRCHALVPDPVATHPSPSSSSKITNQRGHGECHILAFCFSSCLKRLSCTQNHTPRVMTAHYIISVAPLPHARASCPHRTLV